MVHGMARGRVGGSPWGSSATPSEEWNRFQPVAQVATGFLAPSMAVTIRLRTIFRAFNFSR